MTLTPELIAMAKAHYQKLTGDEHGLTWEATLTDHGRACHVDAMRAALMAITPALTDFVQVLRPSMPSAIAAMTACNWVNNILGERG